MKVHMAEKRAEGVYLPSSQLPGSFLKVIIAETLKTDMR